MLITFISLIPFLLGLLILTVAIKGRKGYTPRKAIAKLIRSLLGEKGTRIFAGIIGVIFIFYGINLFMEMNQIGFKSAMEEKSNKVSIVKISVIGSDTTKSYISAPIDMLEHAYNYPNHNFVSISFRNNQITKVPDVVWDMVNLEELNLTNNQIKELSIEKIKKLKKLQTIILINNPISEAELMKIRNELDLNIQTEKIKEHNNAL